MKNSKLRVRFRHLTDYQKEMICNGCGPKGGIIPVPEFLFHASCDHHDFNYWLGCNRRHRKKADLQFYREMLRDAGDSKWYKFWAKIYYRAVRLFGWSRFHYSNRQRDAYDLIKFLVKEENP